MISVPLSFPLPSAGSNSSFFIFSTSIVAFFKILRMVSPGEGLKENIQHPKLTGDYKLKFLILWKGVDGINLEITQLLDDYGLVLIGVSHKFVTSRK